MSTNDHNGDSSTYSIKIFSALVRSTASVEPRNSMLHAAPSESHGPLARSSDPALDIAVHYIKPLRCGGRESSVVVVDLARRFDVLALAQQVGEPHLLDSLSRLHVVHCPCPEALFCTLEKLLLSVVPIALLAVYAAPMHRWHSPQGNMQVARLQELATAHGAKFYAIPPTADLTFFLPPERVIIADTGVTYDHTTTVFLSLFKNH
ncbi:hypothetical protein HPB49_025760 [Dermacentor silvarum]|nr:hypothetical protein HPB49_025760 [Dermacentor silvarum]